MYSDIKRLQKETNGEKIITKSEWMVAAISELEKDFGHCRDEDPKSLYEALFIDPSKLTPY